MIDEELKLYIAQKVFPEYKKNEIGHGIEHINYVIKRSLMFAKQVDNIDIDMVYVIACYHDIGHYVDAKHHEYVSAEMFMKDSEIKKFFNEEDVKTIFEAIQDHRASGKDEPRSIYGKIVSSADRRTDIDNIMRTMFTYCLKHNPSYTIEQNIEEAYSHICRKFARGGYATDKMYFHDDEYEKLKEKAEWFKNNKVEFIKYYCLINNIDTNDLII